MNQRINTRFPEQELENTLPAKKKQCTMIKS